MDLEQKSVISQKYLNRMNELNRPFKIKTIFLKERCNS